MTSFDLEERPSNQMGKRRRSVVLVLGCGALVLVIVLSVRPATIGFHRLIKNGLMAGFLTLHGTAVPESVSYPLLDESDWHKHRLVSLGYLQRRVHKYQFLTVPSPASTALPSDLRKAVGQDCDFSMGQHDIAIYAPPHEIERLMAIIESHDVAPADEDSVE